MGVDVLDDKPGSGRLRRRRIILLVVIGLAVIASIAGLLISTTIKSPAQQAAETTASPRRAQALRLFAANLEKAFYGFEPDFFQQNLVRIVDDVVSVIKGSIELWPTLVEICYFQKDRKGLPQVRVQNQKK